MNAKASASKEVIAFVEGMRKRPGVTDVLFNQDWVEKMQGFSRLAGAIGAFLGGILILTSFFIISNVVKLNVFARKNEIEILRMVGGTNLFIRIPFWLEGITLGLLGSLLSLGLLFIVIRLFPVYLGASLGALQELLRFRYPDLTQAVALLGRRRGDGVHRQRHIGLEVPEGLEKGSNLFDFPGPSASWFDPRLGLLLESTQMASLGQWLRQEREARNISLEEIASATKIVSRYLEAVEADRLDMMPGGFFVKGIIRNYARAVGLDPDEVLGRYKAAGLLSAPDRGLNPAPRPSAGPGLPIELAPLIVPAVVPDLPAEPAGPSEPAPPPVEKAGPSLLIEEAPKPERSPASAKRLRAWTWRALAVLFVFAVFYILLSPRHPRPSQPQLRSQHETLASRSALPPAQKSQPGSAPASRPSERGPAPESKAAVEPAPKTEAPPAVEDAWTGITIELTFQADTWIQVYTDGDLKIDGMFPGGATARARADKKVLIRTGNPGGFTFRLNGKPAKPLSRSGQVLADIIDHAGESQGFPRGPIVRPSDGLTSGPMLSSA